MCDSAVLPAIQLPSHPPQSRLCPSHPSIAAIWLAVYTFFQKCIACHNRAQETKETAPAHPVARPEMQSQEQSQTLQHGPNINTSNTIYMNLQNDYLLHQNRLALCQLLAVASYHFYTVPPIKLTKSFPQPTLINDSPEHCPCAPSTLHR